MLTVSLEEKTLPMKLALASQCFGFGNVGIDREGKCKISIFIVLRSSYIFNLIGISFEDKIQGTN